MPPNPFSQSLAPTSAHARHTSLASAQRYIYNRPPSPIPIQRTERDILLSHHRFLRDESPGSPSAADTYEKNLIAAYDAKLYKEYVLIELSQYRAGRVAMRWRTEQEVKDGKGERVCAGLGCGRGTEEEREVLFNYEEHGEGKEAMVKVRLCAGCARRLRKAKGERRRSRSPRRHRERSRSRERRKRDHRHEKDDSEGKHRSGRRRSRSRSPRRQRERSTGRSKRDDQKEDRKEEKSMSSERRRGDDKEEVNDEPGDRRSRHRTDEKSESTKHDSRSSGVRDRSGSPSRSDTRRKPREKAWA
ncbi:folate-sensitive fragile site protein Fra10Ac1-domain-containing protein [Pyronema domesticum]|nr:folate-sensitive fragile site protein Fra10Ac1-domain-containing protein [Pyronema domesticum]